MFLLSFRGLNLGIDFKGGIVLEIMCEDEDKLNSIKSLILKKDGQYVKK